MIYVQRKSALQNYKNKCQNTYFKKALAIFFSDAKIVTFYNIKRKVIFQQRHIQSSEQPLDRAY